MHETTQSEDQPVERPDPAIEAGMELLSALFAESDTILFRPIESWTNAGKKKSRVIRGAEKYCSAYPRQLRIALRNLCHTSEAERANIYFGVCPRFGKRGRFDLAWQIRIVRALWSDIDCVTVEEARGRIIKADLAQPSIVVNSGNGVHLYWLLDEPYLIDDVGDPPAVETEWTQKSDGRNESRKYLVEDGERMYLDQRRHVSRLSTKGQHIQDVLAGIAQKIGGDHTKDLSRLLRVPGTFNRKDERNGQEPIAATLIECDGTRRYPLSRFESLKSESSEAKRSKQIELMPLPSPRKASASTVDRLHELIAFSGIAPVGGRSEADFAICCYAIRHGISKNEVWTRVEQVGKFAEEGQRYFELTWEKAEGKVRAETFEKVSEHTSGAGDSTSFSSRVNADDSGDNGHRDKIVVKRNTPVRDTLHRVTDCLLATENCFFRTDQIVVINDQSISMVVSSAELAGLLSQYVEFYFVNGESGEYKPFPPAFGNAWLNNHSERRRLPEIKLFTRNPVYANDWRLIRPGFDAPSGIYYAGLTVEPRDDTTYLHTLLKDFCFKEPADRTNYLGMLLTTVLVPHFIGSKPAVLFNGNQPELGKSILAQIIAILRDGSPTETATYNPNDEEFEKRLGAIVRQGATTIIVDNAKCRTRNSSIESACLERSITDEIISFRLLGQSASIRAENSHIFCITANSANISRDLVTRSVVINLYHEGDPTRRSYSITDPEGFAKQHRLTLIGELLGMVERWKATGMPMATTHSRFNKRGWGNTVGGILEVNGQRDFLANAVEAAVLLDETRREFGELIEIMADHPQGLWTPAGLADLCEKNGVLADDLGNGSSHSRATKMGILAGRFIDEDFALGDDRKATFRRAEGRKGNAYQVFVREEMPGHFEDDVT